ncbi:hypothetical protein [Methylobacterium sp. ap11]|uniref:hypothetical protein n=1 Tax=Methylobacterium sp. ap11 TaxID=1761799 RepID=UPI0015A52AB2|nr:hypothetical protein [Methylobacterium sp. ap11]
MPICVRQARASATIVVSLLLMIDGAALHVALKSNPLRCRKSSAFSRHHDCTSLIKALRAAIHRPAGLPPTFRATVVTTESPDRPWFHISAQWSTSASITEQHTAIGVRLVWDRTG